MMRFSPTSTALLLILITLSVVFPHQSGVEDARGWTLDRFNIKEGAVNLTFEPGGGENDTAHIALPEGAPVYRAVLGVEGHPDPGGSYPTNVWLDVGSDGDLEWMFCGDGYGGLNQQNRFLNNETKRSVYFWDNTTNDSASIRLPAGAIVTRASMDIAGLPGEDYGLLLKREDDTACGLQVGSSHWDDFEPILTVNYTEGGSTVLQPWETEAYDTRISLEYPNSNYGTDIWLLTTSTSENRALIRFDLSSVDRAKNVSNAELLLYVYSDDANQVWGMHEVLDPWDETSVTWNDQPAFNATFEGSLDVNWDMGGRWAKLDVTGLVNKWLSVFPFDVTVDFGGDGEVEYCMQGRHNFTNTTVDFAEALNQYLAGATKTFTDDYGNSFVDIPLITTIEGTGGLMLSALNIEYDWTARVFKNPHNYNLTIEVIELADSIQPVGGIVTIPIEVHSDSAGTVQLKDLNITYNGAPRPLMDLPSNLTLDEDTVETHMIDLSLYFEDDYLGSGELEYTIVDNSQEGVVKAYVSDGHWLSVDSDSDPDSQDFNGILTARVRAMDDMGLYAESTPFNITVDPVNDEPVRGPVWIPDQSLNEGGSSPPLDLAGEQYFIDVDGDELFYSAVVDHPGIYVGENITVEIDNVTKVMLVHGNDDFAGDDVPVRIYCDDRIGEVADAHWDILVDVRDLDDDPPLWRYIPPVEVDEDSRLDEAFLIADYVNDIDDLTGDLRFTITGLTNDEFVSVEIDNNNFVDVAAVGDNWTGESTVTLKAKDDGGNFAEQDFLVTVRPVNDLPVVSLKGPAHQSTMYTDGVLLEWEAVDAETPVDGLLFNIHMGEADANRLIAGNISGTEYEAVMDGEGTYYWTVSAVDDVGEGARAKERSFSVELEGPHYGLDLVVSTDSISLAPGDTGELSMEVQNTGGADDDYRLSAVFPGIPDGTVTLGVDDPNEVFIEMGGKVNCTVTLLVPLATAPGNYTLTVAARSLNGGMEERINISVQVVSDESPGPEGGEGGDTRDEGVEVWLLALLCVIVGIVIGSLLLWYVRKRRKRASEESPSAETVIFEGPEKVHEQASPALPAIGGGTPVAPAALQLGDGGPGHSGVEASAGDGDEPLLLPETSTIQVTPIRGVSEE